MSTSPASPSSPSTVVGIGEALFDVFERGPKLGGAPLNVAIHAHALLQAQGGRGVVVSRVGKDDLGGRVRDELARRGMTDDFLQTDAQAPTGRVEVEQNQDGHRFHIAEHSAWDHLSFDDPQQRLAQSCAAVAFGTLAQRHPDSRACIQRFVASAPQAIRLFDVNLRSSDGHDFFDAEVLSRGCELASLVKLNDEELETVCRLTGTRDADDLRDRYALDALIFTRGSDGTAAYTADGFVEGDPAPFDPDEDADTVGAGDACSAGLLAALTVGRSMPEALTLANAVAAYVAGHAGATPDLPASLTQAFSPRP